MDTINSFKVYNFDRDCQWLKCFFIVCILFLLKTWNVHINSKLLHLVNYCSAIFVDIWKENCQIREANLKLIIYIRQGLLFSIFIKQIPKNLFYMTMTVLGHYYGNTALISVKTIRSLLSFFNTEILMNRSRYRVSRAKSRDQIFES